MLLSAVLLLHVVRILELRLWNKLHVATRKDIWRSLHIYDSLLHVLPLLHLLFRIISAILLRNLSLAVLRILRAQDTDLDGSSEKQRALTKKKELLGMVSDRTTEHSPLSSKMILSSGLRPNV